MSLVESNKLEIRAAITLKYFKVIPKCSFNLCLILHSLSQTDALSKFYMILSL